MHASPHPTTQTPRLPTPLGPTGDVCTDLFILGKVLKMLKDKFAVVFFTPGNHELWADVYVDVHVCV